MEMRREKPELGVQWGGQHGVDRQELMGKAEVAELGPVKAGLGPSLSRTPSETARGLWAGLGSPAGFSTSEAVRIAPCLNCSNYRLITSDIDFNLDICTFL